MLASEFAKQLLEQVKLHGDHHVCITQSGYYADGPFAEYTEPTAPESVKDWAVYPESDGEPVLYYVLGHSHQSY